MNLFFIDESGDNGFAPGSTELFVLAGLSVEAVYWKEYFWKVVKFRQEIVQRYGIKLGEIKGGELFSHRSFLFGSSTNKDDVTWIYERLMDIVCDENIEIFCLHESKENFKSRQNIKTALDELTRNDTLQLRKTFDRYVWMRFLSLYDDFLLEKSEKNGRPQNAIVYSDNSGQEKLIRETVRDFSRRFNKEEKFSAAGIVDDIVFRDSVTSLFIQLADVLAFSVGRLEMKKTVPADIIKISDSVKDKLYKKIRFPKN